MESLKNKIVFITGASAGIGEACATEFAKQGANLILSARRIERVKALADKLVKEHGVQVLPIALDVRDRKAVEKTVSSLDSKWKNIDILINNAGMAKGMVKLYEDDVQNWEEIIDTNVKGLLYVTRAILPNMVERKSGHIINLGSIAGYEAYGKGAVYCASKHAVRAITNAVRIDCLDKNVRVSSIAPGMVETEFSEVRYFGDKQKAKDVYKGLEPLTPQDIADTAVFIAMRPKHVNISEVIIMPAAQANAFISYRSE
ncbi:MAG TPA: SDR family oxidoreductase [Ignavibacteriales bacterium]|nr:SDR family oxidoreductase [Ignavibacteriales bacterium]